MKSAVFVLLTLFCFSCTSPAPEPPPEVDQSKNYYFQSETKEQGEGIYCRVQKFTHPETKKSISLIGMVHMADASFYDEIKKLCDKHDLTLSEGVHGNSSLSTHHYLLKYLVASFGRIAYYNQLAAQNYYMAKPDNAINADMSIDDFADESSFWQSTLQTIALPLAVVLGETSNALFWLHHQSTLSAFSEERNNRSSQLFRNVMFTHSDNEKDLSEGIPGILKGRNLHLLKILDQHLQRDEINSIAIPWGAAHMPDLEEQLTTRGFHRDKEETLLNAISLDTAKIALESDKINFFYIPYLAYHYEDPYSSRHSYLASLISAHEIHGQHHFNLGWDLITTYSSGKKGASFSLLPRIFGRPIIFDYRRKNKKQRWRFLYFFSIRSEQ